MLSVSIGRTTDLLYNSNLARFSRFREKCDLGLVQTGFRCRETSLGRLSSRATLPIRLINCSFVTVMIWSAIVFDAFAGEFHPGITRIREHLLLRVCRH